ncbi:glycosyltransferase [Luteithermobacter gelatinilyticus]|uniref:glycosyltransferase n=1 Tax=Luteithermobacter gelatinilyticus TaxID=2582913 RepID=UPI001106D7AF|nr:glycosyltransferase [Luteithermobacter gelatinilyticus]|tara:strand:+ start:7568 stop:8740 length:1173 start_codon:yes stop_codon:yes gene_type:complete
MKLLTFTSLYPNSLQPRHGIFVRTRMSWLDRIGDVERKVIAPVPWFPFMNLLHGSRFRTLNQIPRHEDQDGIDVLHPRYLTLPGTNLVNVADSMARAARPMIEALYTDDQLFDILDGQYLYPDGVAAARLARHFNRPLVLTARGSDVNYWMQQPRPRAAILEALEAAAAVICVSQSLKQTLLSHGLTDTKLTVVPNGVDQTLFHSRQPSPPQQPGYLLCVGNLVPLKGQDLILEALTMVPDWRLVLIGQGPDRKKLRRLVRELGLEKRVVFIEHVHQSDLARYYAHAAATILMSVMEGMPNVMLESLACGTPVIATAVGGIPEVITPENGILLKDRNSATLAQAIQELKLRQWDRKHIEMEMAAYDWSHVARRQYDLYRQVLAASRSLET